MSFSRYGRVKEDLIRSRMQELAYLAKTDHRPAPNRRQEPFLPISPLLENQVAVLAVMGDLRHAGIGGSG